MKVANATLLLVLLFTGNVRAQTSTYHPFPDSNAHWYNHAYITPMGGYVEYCPHYYFDGDTVINNLVYHKLHQYSYGMSGVGFLFGYIRSDSLKRTYFRYQKNPYLVSTLDSFDHVIYDFSLQENDTIVDSVYRYNPPYSQNDMVYMVVDSVRMVLLQNELRKKFYIKEWINQSSSIKYSWWIEGIGSNRGPTSRFFDNYTGTNAVLCRFVLDGLLVYESSPITEYCGYFTNTGEPLSDLKFAVYPNPVYNRVYIFPSDESSANGSSVEVYDFMGQMVSSEIISKIPTVIDTENLCKGVYFVKVGNYIKKILKE